MTTAVAVWYEECESSSLANDRHVAKFLKNVCDMCLWNTLIRAGLLVHQEDVSRGGNEELIVFYRNILFLTVNLSCNTVIIHAVLLSYLTLTKAKLA